MSTVKADVFEENTPGEGLNLMNPIHLDDAVNGRMGTATLVAGTKVVANTSVTANTRVFLSRKTQGTGPGHLSYTLSAGVSFTITSSSGTDDADIVWVLLEPLA